MGKRGQASVEYLVLVGIMLVILIPMVIYASLKVSQELKQSRLEEVVTSLRNAAQSVKALGPGNTQTVLIFFPGGISNISLETTEMVMTVAISGELSSIVIPVGVNLTGNISPNEGAHKIKIEMLSSGIINMTDAQE